MLPSSQLRLGAETVALPGGGSADVFEDEDGDQLVQVTGGRVLPDELVRSVLRTPGLSLRGGVLDLVVVTDTGWDRQVISEDLSTRLLYSRHDDAASEEGGRHVVVIGPPVAEPLAAEAPSSPAAAAAQLVERGSKPVGQLTELPLVVDLGQDGGRASREAALAEAELVVASWGVLDRGYDEAVEDALEACRAHKDGGGGVLVRTRAGMVDAVGADGHPAARDDLRPDDGLTAAPSDWLWGAPLE